MEYWPDKFEVMFFVVGIAISIPLLILFRKLKKQLMDENGPKS